MNIRPRRLRFGEQLRDLAADVIVTPGNLILPLFVRNGTGIRKAVPSMPETYQLSPDTAVAEIAELCGAGLRQFLLFGVIDGSEKDGFGSAAFDETNPVNLTMRKVRDAGLPALLIADLCFCEYTDHGHCGVLSADEREVVQNDPTLAALGRQAVTLARCGADVVAPSGMMDGMVGAVRSALDAEAFHNTAILSYAVKYSSSLYGPFRDAGEGAPQFGDRRSYQMDYRRSREWQTEVALDLADGADMIIVKPAVSYLDIIHRVRQISSVPVAGYHVSGEYSMLYAAAEKGWIDLRAAALEMTYGIRRAGADLVITYFGRRLLEWL